MRPLSRSGPVYCPILLFAAGLFVAAGSATAPKDKFETACTPFNSTAVHHPIDTSCGAAGDNTKAAGILQNQTKNNLCAKEPATDISLATLVDLHKQVVRQNQFSFGTDAKLNNNPDRSALASFKTTDANGTKVDLGEGKLVSLDAFVLQAKHDDIPLLNPKFKGESVNCHDLTPEGNDIHVALVDSADKVAAWQKAAKPQQDQIECTSVTAEIIPHSRPDQWNRIDSHPNTAPAVHGLPVTGLHVKITGQLFFDGSHDPKNCAPPKRSSSWEIHPVYAIEVQDSSGFESFDKWAEQQQSTAGTSGSANKNTHRPHRRRRRHRTTTP